MLLRELFQGLGLGVRACLCEHLARTLFRLPGGSLKHLHDLVRLYLEIPHIQRAQICQAQHGLATGSGDSHRQFVVHIVAETILPSGDHGAGRQALEVPLPRTGVGLAKSLISNTKLRSSAAKRPKLDNRFTAIVYQIMAENDSSKVLCFCHIISEPFLKVNLEQRLGHMGIEVWGCECRCNWHRPPARRHHRRRRCGKERDYGPCCGCNQQGARSACGPRDRRAGLQADPAGCRHRNRLCL